MPFDLKALASDDQDRIDSIEILKYQIEEAYQLEGLISGYSASLGVRVVLELNAQLCCQYFISDIQKIISKKGDVEECKDELNKYLDRVAPKGFFPEELEILNKAIIGKENIFKPFWDEIVGTIPVDPSFTAFERIQEDELSETKDELSPTEPGIWPEASFKTRERAEAFGNEKDPKRKNLSAAHTRTFRPPQNDSSHSQAGSNQVPNHSPTKKVQNG